MKNTILLLLFLLLGSAAYVMINQDDKGSTTLSKKESSFAVEDPSSIAQIRITQKKYPVQLFSKIDDVWYLNNKHKANANIVKNIMEVLTKAKLDHIPHSNAKTNVMNELKRIGIGVEVFDKKGNTLKKYTVGGNNKDEEGTYFLMDGSDQPYVMTLPTFAGSLRSRFIVNVSDSRDQYIFQDLADEIVEIKMEYPKDKSKGFILKKDGGDYVVSPVYSGTPIIDKKVNAKLAKTYFEEFNKVASESIENNNALRDSISSLIPFSELTLKMKNGKTKSLSMIPVNDILDPDVNTVEVENLKKVERFFASSNWGDFYLIQHRLIKGLMRPYSYFFE